MSAPPEYGKLHVHIRGAAEQVAEMRVTTAGGLPRQPFRLIEEIALRNGTRLRACA